MGSSLKGKMEVSFPIGKVSMLVLSMMAQHQCNCGDRGSVCS